MIIICFESIPLGPSGCNVLVLVLGGNIEVQIGLRIFVTEALSQEGAKMEVFPLYS